MSRFLQHARLIKYIELAKDTPLIDTRIFDDLLSFSFPPSISTRRCLTFFPNLRSIKWSWDCVPSDYLCLLLGPAVTRLNLWAKSGPSMECTLDALKYHAPSLTHFTCREVPDYTLTIDTWLGLNIFRTLTVLYLNPTKDIWYTTWYMLSQFPHLHDLESCVPFDDGEERALKHPLSEIHFPSLGALTLHAPMEEPVSFGSFVTECMPVERRPYRLHSFELVCVGPLIETDTTLVIQHMSDLCDREVIRSFQFRGPEEMSHIPGPQTSPDIIPMTLAPLLAFPGLHTISLSPMMAIDLDNDVLEKMARAWGCLALLHLPHTDSHWVHEPRITLEGLIPLAQLCPRLRSITIVFSPEVAVSEEVQRRVDQMEFNNSVTYIAVNWGPFCERKAAEGVARFIKKLFPLVREVDYLYREYEERVRGSEDKDEEGTNSGEEVPDDEGSTVPDSGWDDDIEPGDGREDGDVGVGSSRPSSSKRGIWSHVNRILREQQV